MCWLLLEKVLANADVVQKCSHVGRIWRSTWSLHTGERLSACELCAKPFSRGQTWRCTRKLTLDKGLTNADIEEIVTNISPKPQKWRYISFSTAEGSPKCNEFNEAMNKGFHLKHTQRAWVFARPQERVQTVQSRFRADMTKNWILDKCFNRILIVFLERVPFCLAMPRFWKTYYCNPFLIVIGDSNQTSLVTVKLALLLSCPVYSGEKEKANRAYCSSMDWPNSIFPNSSMELRVPKVCKKYGADKDTILGKILKFGTLLPFLWPAYKIHTYS